MNDFEENHLQQMRIAARLQWWAMILVILSILAAILRPCLESYWDTRKTRIVAQEYAREWAVKNGWKPPVIQAESGK